MEAPAQERFNAEVSLPRLIPFATDYVVAEGVDWGPACKGECCALEGCGNKGNYKVPFKKYMLGG